MTSANSRATSQPAIPSIFAQRQIKQQQQLLQQQSVQHERPPQQQLQQSPKPQAEQFFSQQQQQQNLNFAESETSSSNSAGAAQSFASKPSTEDLLLPSRKIAGSTSGNNAPSAKSVITSATATPPTSTAGRLSISVGSSVPVKPRTTASRPSLPSMSAYNPLMGEDGLSTTEI
jgi:hypothetical protein